MRAPHAFNSVLLILTILFLPVCMAQALCVEPDGTDGDEVAVVWPERWLGEDARAHVPEGIWAVVEEFADPAPAWDDYYFWRANEKPSPDQLHAAELLAGKPMTGDAEAEFVFEQAGALSFKLDPTMGSHSSRVLLAVVGEQVSDQQKVRLDRTWIAVYEPRGERKGTALVIPGMFGTPEPTVNIVVTGLQNRGWLVVRMLSHPSRFTESLRVTVDPEDVSLSAQLIADELGSRTADCAFVAQAVLKHLEDEIPGLSSEPRIALGMSGGAMVLSTVAAREPARYDALVYIAGGADYLSIGMQSNYKDMVKALRVSWGEITPTSEQMRAFQEAYMNNAPMDAYHTAPLVADVPSLMIHGSKDRAVPAWSGDLLWERLNKPTRWSYKQGHEAIFVSLPLRMVRVLNWIEKAVAE